MFAADIVGVAAVGAAVRVSVAAVRQRERERERRPWLVLTSAPRRQRLAEDLEYAHLLDSAAACVLVVRA